MLLGATPSNTAASMRRASSAPCGVPAEPEPYPVAYCGALPPDAAAQNCAFGTLLGTPLGVVVTAPGFYVPLCGAVANWAFGTLVALGGAAGLYAAAAVCAAAVHRPSSSALLALLPFHPDPDPFHDQDLLLVARARARGAVS